MPHKTRNLANPTHRQNFILKKVYLKIGKCLQHFQKGNLPTIEISHQEDTLDI